MQHFILYLYYHIQYNAFPTVLYLVLVPFLSTLAEYMQSWHHLRRQAAVARSV
jgi:hypothetical protein